MLNGAGLSDALRSHLWAEAVNTAALLENHLVGSNCHVSPVIQFFGKGKPGSLSHSLCSRQQKFGHMVTFGEMVIVTNHEKIIGKLENQGKPCMWLGYALENAPGTHQLLDLQTN